MTTYRDPGDTSHIFGPRVTETKALCRGCRRVEVVQKAGEPALCTWCRTGPKNPKPKPYERRVRRARKG